MMIGDSGQGNQLLADCYSGEDTVAQSDRQGKYFCFNMLPVDQTIVIQTTSLTFTGVQARKWQLNVVPAMFMRLTSSGQ